MQQVVEAHGTRVQLALREAGLGAEEERHVGAEAEDGDLPVAGAVPGRLEDDGDEQEGAECGVCDAGSRAPGLDGGCGVAGHGDSVLGG